MVFHISLIHFSNNILALTAYFTLETSHRDSMLGILEIIKETEINYIGYTGHNLYI